jgi:predicted tellurium resistance membrane protein TerC
MTLIAIGLVISVPVIMLGATIIANVLDRFPWVGMIGAGLIGWIAGGVIADDGRLDQLDAQGRFIQVVQPGSVAAFLDSIIPEAEMVCSGIGVALVLLLGLWLVKRNKIQSEKA